MRKLLVSRKWNFTQKILFLEVSNAAISSLIEQKVQHVWNSLGEAQASWMKKQSEMLEKINKLETSEKKLKNQVKIFKNQNENVVLNNKELMEKVEEVKEENAGLLKEHKIEREKLRSESNFWWPATIMLVMCIFVTTSVNQSFAEALKSNLKNEIEQRQNLELKISEEITQLRQV